jgi:glycolate oxidase iron-sulfur subunit
MDFKKLPPVQEQLMKCVRCGKCRSVCPVFAEIRNETAAPRGHVFMVQMLRDGKVEPHQEVYDHLAKCSKIPLADPGAMDIGFIR